MLIHNKLLCKISLSYGYKFYPVSNCITLATFYLKGIPFLFFPVDQCEKHVIPEGVTFAHELQLETPFTLQNMTFSMMKEETDTLG